MKILWFDDIEVWNQPVFDLPLMGRVSIRQICFIGLALILTFSSRDILVAIVSFSIALPLTMLKYRSLGLDELALNITIYLLTYKVYLLLRGMLKRIKRIGIISIIINLLKGYIEGEDLKDMVSDGKGIIVVNTDTIRLKLRLLDSDGKEMGGRLASIYLDDDHISSIVSDQNGEVEALISLSDEFKVKVDNGLHRLKVVVDNRVVFIQGIKLSRV